MRILVVSQYFWPENFIINDIVKTLNQQGHHVTVATGKPNYPDGKIFDGYKASGIASEFFLDGVKVFRVPIWPRGKGGAKNLIINYFSFIFWGLLAFPFLLRKNKFDAIFVFAPSPITQVIPAIFIKLFKRAKLVLWVQDLWPESLSATGHVKNIFLLKLVGVIVKGVYMACDRLLVQSRAFIAPVAKYVTAEKVYYYPNSINASNSSANCEIPEELERLLKSHFCVVFAGNLGVAQSLETVVDAASQLKELAPDVRIVLVGSGSRFDWLQEIQASRRLENICLPGRFPADSMPRIFEYSSALLVSLKNEHIFAQTIPSKVQAYLAAGKPILASLNGEGARVILDSGAGMVSPAEDVAALVRNIIAMRDLSAQDRSIMSMLGKKYFCDHFEMSSRVSELVSHLSLLPVEDRV